MRLSVLFAGVAAGLCISRAPLAAQAPVAGKVAQITPYAGYMVFGDYLKGPFGTSISNASSPVYGAQLGLRLSPNISVIGNLGYTSSNIRVGLPLLGGFSIGSSSMLIYDGDLELGLPKDATRGLPISPFVQVGAGAIRYNIDESIIHTNATNFAANVGIGGDIALGRDMGLRLMAKDYIGKFNFQQATNLDIQGQTAHNWALSAGLRFDF